jgi:hypothetical protein
MVGLLNVQTPQLPVSDPLPIFCFLCVGTCLILSYRIQTGMIRIASGCGMIQSAAIDEGTTVIVAFKTFSLISGVDGCGEAYSTTSNNTN